MSDQLEPELERIAQMLRDAGPLPDAPATLRDRALSIPDGVPLALADAGEPAVAPPPPLTRLRQRRRPSTRALLGIAAVIAALVIVPTAILSQRGGSGEQDIALSPRVFAPNGGGTAAVVSHDDGSATISLTVWKLPQQQAGHVYKTWLGRKGDRRALGEFEVGANGKATVTFTVPSDELDGYRWLWVTSEQAGSGSTPSGDTALWGPLT